MKQYICLNEDEKPLQLDNYEDTPRHGILLRGNIATVFNSYSSARRAIQRTKQYAENKGYNWSVWKFSIMRLMPR